MVEPALRSRRLCWTFPNRSSPGQQKSCHWPGVFVVVGSDEGPCTPGRGPFVEGGMDSFFQPAGDDPEAYLSSGRYVDYEHADIAELSDQLWSQANSREDYVRASFEWVRDSIRHSWDAGDSVVSISASDAAQRDRALLCQSAPACGPAAAEGHSDGAVLPAVAPRRRLRHPWTGRRLAARGVTPAGPAGQHQRHRGRVQPPGRDPCMGHGPGGGGG